MFSYEDTEILKSERGNYNERYKRILRIKHEELNVIKEEAKALNKKLTELTEEELEQVVGGGGKAPVYNAGKTHKDATK